MKFRIYGLRLELYRGEIVVYHKNYELMWNKN